MTAREKFTKGQRVQLTPEGHTVYSRHRKRQTPVHGTVVGFGREPMTVVVVQDGLKTRYTWHMKFWEPHVPPPAPNLMAALRTSLESLEAKERELDTSAQLDLSVDLNNPQEG